MEKNREHRPKLEAFAQGNAGFEDLNRLVAAHLLGWRIYEGKGIFREGGAGRMALLDEDVRPSIEEVGCANWFPFKTSGNQGPSKTSPFRQHVWTTYLRRLLELLAPKSSSRWAPGVAGAKRRNSGPWPDRRR